MVTVVNREEIQPNGQAAVFEGYQYGEAPVSFFLVDAPPGGDPRLHRHPYAEVFVVQEGRATFTAGTETLEVGGGQIVVVPPGLPHTFVNAGDIPLRQVAIHASGRMITEWLEE